MQVNPDAGESLYLQVARLLRQDIIEGRLEVGDPVPSGREVYERFGIGRNTYSRAIHELKREGLLAVRAGIGTYVTARPALKVVEIGPGDQVAARAPTDDERDRLGISLLVPVMTVMRADGSTEVHSAAVTVARVTCPP